MVNQIVNISQTSSCHEGIVAGKCMQIFKVCVMYCMLCIVWYVLYAMYCVLCIVCYVLCYNNTVHFNSTNTTDHASSTQHQHQYHNHYHHQIRHNKNYHHHNNQALLWGSSLQTRRGIACVLNVLWLCCLKTIFLKQLFRLTYHYIQLFPTIPSRNTVSSHSFDLNHLILITFSVSFCFVLNVGRRRADQPLSHKVYPTSADRRRCLRRTRCIGSDFRRRDTGKEYSRDRLFI